jgi:EmrB/QacA subfamily drug resistance transporter
MSTLVIALPAMVRSLHVGIIDVVWILLAYMLAQTAAVLTVGRLGDIWGRKRLYVSGFALFTVMALIAGFASTTWLLIALRALAGIGGALMVANSGAIVTDAFPRRELGVALGINAMVIAVGSAVGPVLGGWLTSFGWEWVFWFNVPLGLLGTVWSYAVLHDPAKHRGTQRLDWTGNALFVIAMTGLLLTLSMGGIEGWTNPLVVAGGVAFAVGAPLFVLVERRVRDPLLDFNLFKNRLFTIANVAQLINGTSRMGLLFLLIFYFQGPAQKDAVTTGILVLPLAGVLFLVSGPSGWISDHIGSRIPATTGLLFTAIGLVGMAAVISLHTPYPVLAFWMVLVGVGGGLFNSPNSSSIMAAVSPEQRGVASGVRMLVAFTGAMLSIAFVLAIVTSSMPKSVMLKIFAGVTTGLPDSALQPFITGIKLALYTLGIISLLTVPLSLIRGEERRRSDDPHLVLSEPTSDLPG